MRLLVGWLAFTSTLSGSIALAVDNNWTNAASGKWEAPSNWSIGIPPSNGVTTITITNTGFKTVTIDAATTNTPGVMSVSNLVVSAPVGFTNTLALSNAGLNVPLRMISGAVISNGCIVTITNSILRADGASGIKDFSITMGSVTLDSGSLIVTNIITSGLRIGGLSRGQLTVNNGTVLANGVNVGSLTGAAGTLTINGGEMRCAQFMSLGSAANATGAIWINGTGRLAVTNNVAANTFFVGDSFRGQVTVSNGTLLAREIQIGQSANTAGTLTMAGGSAVLTSNLLLATAANNCTGIVTMTGGQLTATNANINVGFTGIGLFSLLAGTVQTMNFTVGARPTGRGTLTVTGGTLTAMDGLIVGDVGGSTGAVWMSGGMLVLTNFTKSEIGDEGVGMMTLSNGSVLVSELSVSDGEINTIAPSAGTLTMAVPGGTILCTSNFFVSHLIGATGTVWVSAGQLTVTNGISRAAVAIEGFAQMIISNGTVTAREFTVGESNTASGAVTVFGGTINITRPTLDADLNIGHGNFTLNGGALTVDSLVVTNSAGSFVQNAGLVNVRATAITNGATFFIGDGINPATYHLLSGVHSFPAGLNIRVNGQLTGCGTINGPVVNNGTVTIDCVGGSLTFNGIVTNNATIRALNGSVFEAYALVVNNGTIDITGGNTNFHAGFVNNGTIVGGVPGSGDSDGDGLTDAQELLAGTNPNSSTSTFAVASVSLEGNSLRVRWTMGPGKTNALQRSAGNSTGGYTTNFVDIFTVTNTVGTVANYLDTGAVTNKPARYYRVRLVP